MTSAMTEPKITRDRIEHWREHLTYIEPLHADELSALCTLALQALDMEPRPKDTPVVFAWTEEKGYDYYPQFINISVSPNAELLYKREGMALYVRGPEATDNDGTSTGFTTLAIVPIAVLREMAKAILTSLPEPRR